MLDLLIITPNSSGLYQDLSKKYSAKEPNIWGLILSNSMKRFGYNVEYIDAEVDNIEDFKLFNPKLILFIATGQNPNASSASMQSVVDTAKYVKEYKNVKIAVVGPHVNALPVETLEKEQDLDIVFTNEGVYALRNLLQTDLSDVQLRNVKGIAYRDSDGHVNINVAERTVPQELLSQDLPGIDLSVIDYKKYRTSTWHTNYVDDATSPFASIYTSLGCPFQCQFCMINIINRDNNDLSLAADSFNKFRYWEPEHMIKWFDHFAENGVKNIKIADELFVLRPDHCMKLCDLIIERGYDFNIWAYTRINTVKEKYLETFKKAGINWLAIGIESGSSVIRTEITKGHFKDENIYDVIAKIKNAGINVGGNYIFGLGHDDYNTMEETFNLMVELNCENSNMYAAMALPGSPLYFQAKKEGWKLPTKYSEYGFLSYDCLPTPTYCLSAAEVLEYRDKAFHRFYESEKFLTMIKGRFGQKSVDNIKNMTKIKLKRKILGE